MKIRLEPVTVASRAAVERLETAPGQEGFVESVAECLAEADRRRCWRPVGVYDGDALIGFAMYGFFWEYLPFGRLWLDRLLIDRRFQGRGYGRAALAALLERLEELNQIRQTTILMVTHDAFTASCCHRVIFLRDGQIFLELSRGGMDRRAFFAQIIRVVSQLGGEMEDVL